MVMKFSNGNPPDDPLGRGPVPPRKRTTWEAAARKALGSWAGGTEASVAAAIEEAYGQGIAFAAKFIEEKRQPELARALKAETARP